MTLTAAYDATEPPWTDFTEDERCAFWTWLVFHDQNPGEIYRFELHVIDCPLIRVFAFDLDADGRLHCPLDHDHRAESCEAARREPYDVLQMSDPPVQPWSRTP